MRPRCGPDLPPVFRTSRPLVFAHRGGAGLAPENTLAAFARGLAAGADGFECDVHLSADGVPVVIHDPTLDRTTDATGPVAGRTAAELARVDAGYRFDAAAGAPWRGRGVGVPALEQVLTSHPEARVIIEMKLGGPALAEAVARVVRRADAVDRVCVGSFHVPTVAALRAADPAIVSSASAREVQWTLYRSWTRWPAPPATAYRAFQVPERSGRLRIVSAGFVRQVHREGCVVQVWVVDRPDDAARLLGWGVDGLITDRPDLIVPARDAFALIFSP
ncbi:MAG: glycerophosphodiester phosphodiesterase [Vicinamibacterales bacterium]|nr:glycerophosphodiester phosphodiesterase [Vicinamibacterales bacterium]